MKDGWKSTEFWITMVTNIWAVFGGVLQPEHAAMVMGFANGGYAIARGLAKGGVIRGTVGDELKK